LRAEGNDNFKADIKLAVVYNPLDNKLRKSTYSYVYRGMFEAILKRFKPVHITGNRDVKDLNVDAILFWDVNSTHHITLKEVAKHPAIKYEYMSDPFQDEVHGIYRKYNMPVHKLGAKQRIYRALDRGVRYIISSNTDGYFKYFTPILNESKLSDMLVFFPHAPWFDSVDIPIVERNKKILANGATISPKNGYAFRRVAFESNYVTNVNHGMADEKIPSGVNYHNLLKDWSGALALSENYIVPKYLEMPLAGCLTFMQKHNDLVLVGFIDSVNCVIVNKDNYEDRFRDFINNIDHYQEIADRGRLLVQNNYTAKHFAEYIYNHIEEKVNGDKDKEKGKPEENTVIKSTP